MAVTRCSGYTAEFDRVTREEWSSLLRLFDDATIIQTWDFPESVCPGQQVSRLVLRRGEEVVALAQARIVATPLIARGIAYVAWGPLWRRQGRAPSLEIFDAALAALQNEFVERRKLLLRISPNIVGSEFPEARRMLAERGFSKARQAGDYRTIMIDISVPLPEVRGNLERTRRQHLANAERTALEVRQGTALDYYEKFKTVYRAHLSRKGLLTDVDIGRWEKLQETLPEIEKPQILVACDRGEAVGAFVVSCLGGTSFPIAVAATEAGLKANASPLLYWRALEWLKGEGCRTYDMGGIDPEGNPGGYQFKKGFGGKDVTFIGTFEECRNALSRGVVSLSEPMYTLAKRLARVRKSRLFSRGEGG
ncbi:lipid II:glycine glycyltransferase FemX [Geobacter pickeringii]|uniref:N-acetyltransferase domain-containing protein n=1 Tax=Geobacter pickeringii TaxID=345632 RepID=A0A0B5BFF8_9BACT|nr:GNAT family N-acetyltransferase [Geobacter pickeringii]AJE02806.1 hypothetical protein GPICK_04990 [Geobacter pickeringii]